MQNHLLRRYLLLLKCKNYAMMRLYGLLYHCFNIFQKTATSIIKKQLDKAPW